MILKSIILACLVAIGAAYIWIATRPKELSFDGLWSLNVLMAGTSPTEIKRIEIFQSKSKVDEIFSYSEISALPKVAELTSPQDIAAFVNAAHFDLTDDAQWLRMTPSGAYHIVMWKAMPDKQPWGYGRLIVYGSLEQEFGVVKGGDLGGHFVNNGTSLLNFIRQKAH